MKSLPERFFAEFILPAPVPPPLEGGKQAQVSLSKGSE